MPVARLNLLVQHDDPAGGPADLFEPQGYGDHLSPRRGGACRRVIEIIDQVDAVLSQDPV